MTDKCWHRTGPVTFCGRPAEHSIHHIQPDTFRFHPFQAKPRVITEVKYREKAAIEREAGVTADRVYVADIGTNPPYTCPTCLRFDGAGPCPCRCHEETHRPICARDGYDWPCPAVVSPVTASLDSSAEA